MDFGLGCCLFATISYNFVINFQGNSSSRHTSFILFSILQKCSSYFSITWVFRLYLHEKMMIKETTMRTHQLYRQNHWISQRLYKDKFVDLCYIFRQNKVAIELNANPSTTRMKKKKKTRKYQDKIGLHRVWTSNFLEHWLKKKTRV